jgi:hypothetical protein
MASETCFQAEVMPFTGRKKKENPHKLSEDQKRTSIQLAISLQAEFEMAQRRNWTEFHINDESCVL